MGTPSTVIATPIAGISQKCADHSPCLEITYTVVQPSWPIMPALNDVVPNTYRLLEDRPMSLLSTLFSKRFPFLVASNSSFLRNRTILLSGKFSGINTVRLTRGHDVGPTTGGLRVLEAAVEHTTRGVAVSKMVEVVAVAEQA